MTRNFLLIGLAALIFAIGIKAFGGQRVARNVICLMDFSSTISQDDHKGYLDVIFNSVLGRQLESQDRIKIFPIDAGAVRERAILFNFDREELKLKDKNDGLTGAAAAQRGRLIVILEEARKELEKTILQNTRNKQFGNATNIFGALRQLTPEAVIPEEPSSFWQKWLNPKPRWENVAIVFSDMIQEADGMDFNDKRLDFSSLLDDLTAKNQVPNLENWTVFVFGIRGSARMDDRHFEAMQKFWTDWFEASQCDLKAMVLNDKSKIEAYFNSE